jgi:hypothetical protein
VSDYIRSGAMQLENIKAMSDICGIYIRVIKDFISALPDDNRKEEIEKIVDLLDFNSKQISELSVGSADTYYGLQDYEDKNLPDSDDYDSDDYDSDDSDGDYECEFCGKQFGYFQEDEYLIHKELCGLADAEPDEILKELLNNQLKAQEQQEQIPF